MSGGEAGGEDQGESWSPAAGWYPTDGGLRWWDGTAWGPLAPGHSDEVSSGKTLAIISHFGVFACYVVLPLVIRLTEGKKNAYVRHHSTEALNFMITFGVLWNLVWFSSFFVGAFLSAGSGNGFPIVFLILWPLSVIVGISVLVFSILGAVRASQGVWWRYPISIRFVRGAAPR